VRIAPEARSIIRARPRLNAETAANPNADNRLSLASENQATVVNRAEVNVREAFRAQTSRRAGAGIQPAS
jgi:hypothetical protein